MKNKIKELENNQKPKIYSQNKIILINLLTFYQ